MPYSAIGADVLVEVDEDQTRLSRPAPLRRPDGADVAQMRGSGHDRRGSQLLRVFEQAGGRSAPGSSGRWPW